MAQKIVSRGYVVVFRNKNRGGVKACTAVVSGPDAERLQKKVGGVIVPVKGMAYRMAQKTLRVLVNPAEAISLADKA